MNDIDPIVGEAEKEQPSRRHPGRWFFVTSLVITGLVVVLVATMLVQARRPHVGNKTAVTLTVDKTCLEGHTNAFGEQWRSEPLWNKGLELGHSYHGITTVTKPNEPESSNGHFDSATFVTGRGVAIHMDGQNNQYWTMTCPIAR